MTCHDIQSLIIRGGANATKAERACVMSHISMCEYCHIFFAVYLQMVQASGGCRDIEGSRESHRQLLADPETRDQYEAALRRLKDKGWRDV